jgi:hypothetical protein
MSEGAIPHLACSRHWRQRSRRRRRLQRQQRQRRGPIGLVMRQHSLSWLHDRCSTPAHVRAPVHDPMREPTSIHSLYEIPKKMLCCRLRQSRQLVAAMVAAGRYDSQSGRMIQDERVTTFFEASNTVSSKTGRSGSRTEGRQAQKGLPLVWQLYTALFYRPGARARAWYDSCKAPTGTSLGCHPASGAGKLGVCRLRPAWLSFYMLSEQHVNVTFIGQLQPCRQSKCFCTHLHLLTPRAHLEADTVGLGPTSQTCSPSAFHEISAS